MEKIDNEFKVLYNVSNLVPAPEKSRWQKVCNIDFEIFPANNDSSLEGLNNALDQFYANMKSKRFTFQEYVDDDYLYVHLERDEQTKVNKLKSGKMYISFTARTGDIKRMGNLTNYELSLEHMLKGPQFFIRG